MYITFYIFCPKRVRSVVDIANDKNITQYYSVW